MGDVNNVVNDRVVDTKSFRIQSRAPNATKKDFIDIRDDFDRLANDKHHRNGEQNNAKIGFTPLFGSHFGFGIDTVGLFIQSCYGFCAVVIS